MSTGTIETVSCNYIIVALEEEAECVVTGRKYRAVKNSCMASLPAVAVGKSRKTKKYSGCTVMDAEQAKEAAERILEYYQMQQLVEMRYVNDGEGVGDWCSITMRGARYAVTGIASQTIDLTGGFVASASCRGYSKVVTEVSYAGEFYAGERGMV